MGTTTNGLPYPEPTDAVANGAAAIRSLAEAVDPSIRSGNAVVRPVVVAADQVGFTGATFLTGFSQTITVVAGRLYEVSWLICTQQNTAAGQQTFNIDLAGVPIGIGLIEITNPGGIRMFDGSMHFAGGGPVGTLPAVAAGARIIRLMAYTSAATMGIRNTVVNGRYAITELGPIPAT